MQNMIAMKIKYKTEKWTLHNLAGANMVAVSSIKATARKSNVTMAFNATRKLRNVHISHLTAAKDWPAWYTAHLHCSSSHLTAAKDWPAWYTAQLHCSSSHLTAAKDWPAWYTAHLHCSSYEMTSVHQQ